ncbi:TrmH family RNA methyltransferase [Mesorhizobium sp. ZMM04-5]|uniref:TrmH family RNA methyltransferase n=1 Tax=Mesorhizobium marinum TaxID=3228790 RepID=A0ABV3QU15_9HYPH
MNLISIDDPGDPRAAAYLSIRERDLAGRQGRFVAEGKVVLEVLFSAARFEPESVLVLDKRLAGLTDTLHKAPPSMPVYVAPQSVMDEIAGFHIHRGILAVARRRHEDDAEALIASLPPRAVVPVLVGLSNHDNVGAIFRNAAAFGANAVLLDATCCDPLYRKAIRVSVGAALKVPFATVESAGSLVDLLDRHGFTQIALSPAGTTDIRDASPPHRLALYLGAEGPGLPDELLSRLQTVRIGMAPGFDSLNVAAASAIALHRFAN